MALVVRRIEVFAIPARREDHCRADASGAVLGGKLSSVLGVAWRKALAVLETAMAKRGAARFLGHGVAGNHAEAGLEGGHLAIFGGVGHIVHGHAAVLLDAYIGELRDTLKGGVVWGLKV
jgi:hypothetical protein